MLMKGVHVTNVQVEVPAAMYNEHHRATAEARSTTVTICDDKERREAWLATPGRDGAGTAPGHRQEGHAIVFGGATTLGVVVALG